MRLKAIRFEGDFQDVADQFADVLAEGEHPPPQQLKALFLSRFPYDMVRTAIDQDFDTWVEIREFMRESRGAHQERALEWYENAPWEFRQEAAGNHQLVREGWLPVKAKKGNNKNEGDGQKRPNGDKSEGRNGRNKGNSDKDKARREGKCFTCQGKGHIARNCPNDQLSAKKDGQRCHKCGGMGHWASACPSPPNDDKGDNARVKAEQGSTNKGNQGNGSA